MGSLQRSLPPPPPPPPHKLRGRGIHFLNLRNYSSLTLPLSLSLLPLMHVDVGSQCICLNCYMILLRLVSSNYLIDSFQENQKSVIFLLPHIARAHTHVWGWLHSQPNSATTFSARAKLTVSSFKKKSLPLTLRRDSCSSIITPSIWLQDRCNISTHKKAAIGRESYSEVSTVL